MDLVLFILGILYLCGFGVGKTLAVCAIIEEILILIKAYLESKQEIKKCILFFFLIMNGGQCSL